MERLRTLRAWARHGNVTPLRSLLRSASGRKRQPSALPGRGFSYVLNAVLQLGLPVAMLFAIFGLGRRRIPISLFEGFRRENRDRAQPRAEPDLFFDHPGVLRELAERSSVRKTAYAMSIMLASISLGCSVRGVVTSVPPRIFREVHGLRVRSYQINPVTEDLRGYKAIEVHQLENLMLDQIPQSSVNQLNLEIAKGLRSLKNFELITDASDSQSPQRDATNQSAVDVAVDRSRSVLVLDGYIDDYTPGIPKLRYIEQGNNHAVLTVRIQLKDKQTTRVLAEINITVENTRITSNVARMVEKTGKEVVSFVDRSTSHYTRPKEVARYVQQ